MNRRGLLSAVFGIAVAPPIPKFTAKTKVATWRYPKYANVVLIDYENTSSLDFGDDLMFGYDLSNEITVKVTP